MTHPRVGVNTYGYLWGPSLRECMTRLARRGYSVFEGVINSPHLDIELSPQGRRELRSFMEDRGLSFSSLNLPSLDTNLASPFAFTRQYSVEMFRRAIDLAADLGAPQLVTVPGRLNPLLPPGKAALAEWVEESIAALIPHARERGVGLALENVPFASMPRARDLADFVDRMGNEDVLGVCYDVANAHFIGESLKEGIEILGPRMRLMHCSDTTRTQWRHDAVGQGDVPWGELAVALGASAWCGPLLLEIIDPDPEHGVMVSHDALAAQGIIDIRKQTS